METSTLIRIILFGIFIGISILLFIVNIAIKIITKRDESKKEERILKRNEYLLLSSSGMMFTGIVGLVVTLNHTWIGYRIILSLLFEDLMLIVSLTVLFWGFIFVILGYKKTKVKIKRQNASEVEFNISVYGILYIVIALILLLFTMILYFSSLTLVYTGF